jgi:hypothetical protein
VASPTEVSIVGAKQGDWAMYVGAPPSEEYEWVQVSVLQVNGSLVDLSMRFDLRARFRYLTSYYFPDHPHLVSIDVESGTSNFFLYLIPRNLTVGSTVPVPNDHAPMKIEGAEKRKCAGADRMVVYASFSNMTVVYAPFKTAGRYYWDQETGLLVERVATFGGVDLTSEKLADTNLWSPDIALWIVDNCPVLIMLIVVLGVMAIFASVLMRMRKNIPCRVTHINVGKGLFVIGVVLMAAAVVDLTSFKQLVSLFCLAFAPFFLVSGALAYTGVWVALKKDKLVVDLGVVLIASAAVLSGIVIGCMMYREMWAIVPYIDPENTVGASMYRVAVYTTLEGVFFYPFTWLSSLISPFVICLAVTGILYKVASRF